MNPEPALRALQSGVLAATSSKSSGSPVFLIFLLALFAVYFLWLRPKRNQMRAQQSQRLAAEVGDEVVTTGGIIGRVLGFEGDRAELEVSPGQSLTVLRSALGRRVDPPVPESSDDSEELADHEGPDFSTGTDDTDDSAPRRWWPGSKGGTTPPSEPDGSN